MGKRKEFQDLKQVSSYLNRVESRIKETEDGRVIEIREPGSDEWIALTP